jgi:hypothetical protein
MKSNISLPQPVTFFAILFPLFAFGFSLSFSYQQEKNFVFELGRLTWFHFLYAKSLKDDMAIIDWSKNLENIKNVKAFQVTENSKSIAEGGNKEILPILQAEGVSYLFPTSWFFKISSQKDPQSRLEFFLVYQTQPGCLFWGVFAFIVGFTPFWVMKIFGLAPYPKKNPEPVSSHQERVDTISPNPLKFLTLQTQIQQADTPFIFIDKDYVVQQVTPKALELLKRDPFFVEKKHLIDLSPDQTLINAMKAGKEVKILTPFLNHPGLSISIKPNSDGFLLTLERSIRSDTP